MAIRWRKYHPACKGKRQAGDRYGKVVGGVDCEGRRGKHCPEGVPSPCGAWAIDYREFDGRWVSKVFPGINKTQAGELLEEIKSNIRRRIFGLPTKKKIPTLGEYALIYLELCRSEKDVVKDSSINIDIAILSHIFTTAIKAGIIGINPCKGVRKLKVVETKDRILNPAEISLLMDRLQGRDKLTDCAK